ncbi:HGGxSTG domain-containing protein [Devosia litorisediminis]|uniref:HGGxSTG domain-containing protein n=1 Tax=Devosia litorisediminis TaxID=2829817 RepID=UPI003D05D076
MEELGLGEDGRPVPFLQRSVCCARTRAGAQCRNRVVPGKRRCRFHGGLSTGPKTHAGRKRIADAQTQRWALYRAEKKK